MQFVAFALVNYLSISWLNHALFYLIFEVFFGIIKRFKKQKHIWKTFIDITLLGSRSAFGKVIKWVGFLF